ncbi:MAG TPA: hypothetical protein VEC01_15920 [Noviherbaspirillum sp.]|uniref:hypothetical protein n=1 Tax=Noviherbaspirillum sp. TaxID=1926288 RepID=UPI002D3B068D|nr:hypothetical protein [Noviherbaspirillum sp.]HYD96817.1 hypothetical protein [Noviherbaspirillum sp.]
MHSIPETKKNHLWRKVIWHTDPEVHPLGPFHSIEVYCCEESNGFAVWYVRKLARDDSRGKPGMENGDYLLNFYSKTARDAAIERAVLLANGGPSADKVIAALDELAAAAQKV